LLHTGGVKAKNEPTKPISKKHVWGPTPSTNLKRKRE